MKKPLYFLILCFAFLLSGCHSKEHQIIKDFELEFHQIEVIKIKSEGSLSPFYSHDSIKMLEIIYDSLRNQKIESLEKQLGIVRLKIDNAEIELRSIENPLMAKAYNSRIQMMKEDHKKIEKVLLIYKTSPEIDVLSKITDRIAYLNQRPDSIIGYTTKIVFLGKQGDLPDASYQRNYMFNYEKDSIMAIL